MSSIILTPLTLAALSYMNVPYKWGGFDTLGMDCSALVVRSFWDTGWTIPNMSSQNIYRWALNQKGAKSCEPDTDCLLFFGGSDRNITHVAISVSPDYMIEAGGAGRDSLQMSDHELAIRDARVRIRPINNRRDLVASVYVPYLKKE